MSLLAGIMPVRDAVRSRGTYSLRLRGCLWAGEGARGGALVAPWSATGGGLVLVPLARGELVVVGGCAELTDCSWGAAAGVGLQLSGCTGGGLGTAVGVGSG